MEYYVTFAIDARYTAKVEAESLEEAKKKARLEWYAAGIGELDIVDSWPVTVEDDKDNIIWEA